jgi:hypothetical protein
VIRVALTFIARAGNMGRMDVAVLDKNTKSLPVPYKYLTYAKRIFLK